MAQTMIVTEAEAAEKWCPESMTDNGSYSVNRYAAASFYKECCCLGSHCMWWIWVDGEHITDEQLNRIDPRQRRGCCGAIVR